MALLDEGMPRWDGDRVIKKGQLRRWTDTEDGEVFMTIGYEIIYGEDRRAELGWSGARRCRKVWTILQDGTTHAVGHIEIETYSKVISETR